MSAKLAFRLAFVAAIMMLVVATFMSITAPPCNPLPMSTLTAFELVRSANDLTRIFGEAGDACRAALVPQLDHANVVDTFAYIPAYTAFFALAAWGLGDRARGPAWLAVCLALACAIADVLENLAMFALSATPDANSPWMTVLIVFTNVKWVGLALVTTLCGVMLARRGGYGWIGLLLCAAPLVSSIWAVIDPDAAGQFLIPGMVVASVTLLAVCGIGAVRGDQSAKAAAG
jgi:hypothetical protein